MVRRDDDDRSQDLKESRCASPAGASPASVSVGAPSSRSPESGEILEAEARRQEPRNGRQGRGPQHEVKLAASKEKQSGSRAAHVTAKATSAALVSERAVDSGGVWRAARVQGAARNTGDPSLWPSSRQGASYKPKVKSSAAERESEGAVVLSIDAKNNASGGRGPCGGHVVGAGKREGMAASSGPTNP